MDIVNVEEACHYRFAQILKNNLVTLQLSEIRFTSCRDLSMYLEDLNFKVITTIDIQKIHFKINDYDQLEHLYYVFSRFRSLKKLTFPLIEHKSVSQLAISRHLQKLSKTLATISFRISTPQKLPSEISIFLCSMLRDLTSTVFFPNITYIAFECEYLLNKDQLKRVIEKRLQILKLEYVGSQYDIGDRLEIR